ncbi:glucose 1-dehydrogenase [Spongiactinospora sp. TRM90649]|uniref:glucose 1-dehydrogenase n=1 Tax=Spongiactinospora sp. TRM90649 TaxID=3031114 RepID=UPI0023F7687A|nr:glucose 1-dehydrogenase [Spongiactinospora sp. TRM90649]MDF5756049.1 glucose 1-dehydrogenase [Spongiactinospora sp. TRM90649]
MRAITVEPGQKGSLRVEDVPDPVPGRDDLLVQGLALGICGTDREIASGEYGWPPEGHDRLILGHESLGRVVQAPAGSGFTEGDLVVGVVRRPDPVPCGACAQGEFDMCRNNRYVERGIKQLDGFGSERWTIEAGYAVKLDPALEYLGVLMEPTTVLAKAWDQIERIGARAWFEPRRVLVTGAGPIGLLAALLGRQRGLEVAVLDRVTEGIKPELVRALGAEYHTGTIAEAVGDTGPDIIIEATGAGRLVFDAMEKIASGGIVCLTGVSTSGRDLRVDAGAISREIVLENNVIFGSVNANLRHYQLATVALAAADRSWLSRLITRRIPLADVAEAMEPDPDDIKVVVDLTA